MQFSRSTRREQATDLAKVLVLPLSRSKKNPVRVSSSKHRSDGRAVVVGVVVGAAQSVVEEHPGTAVPVRRLRTRLKPTGSVATVGHQ